jgi:hypothetical protein
MNKQERVALAAEMQDHIQAWQQSEQSQLRYCQENNLTYHKFVYWLSKIRRKQNPVDQVFIPVGIKRSSSFIPTDIEIIFPNGVRLRVASGNMEIVHRLIRLF